MFLTARQVVWQRQHNRDKHSRGSSFLSILLSAQSLSPLIRNRFRVSLTFVAEEHRDVERLDV
jgi:hypothetical protein